MNFLRPQFKKVQKRIEGKRLFIQVLIGPRQVGKTTLVNQLQKNSTVISHYESADNTLVANTEWIQQQWNRLRVKLTDKRKKAVLILDEIQKIPNWSEAVKKEWDKDTKEGRNIQVILLGSPQMLMQKGLTESLAGRFETIYMPHWSFKEMQDVFGYKLDEYVFFGGYPGAASLIKDFGRWSNYIKFSLIETTISKDILMMNTVQKPILLRRLFEFGALYSAQILSYQKMLGQLQDAGNTTTLAHYLDLLNGAGFLTGLQKYSTKEVKKRGSSPKLIIQNTGLLSALKGMDYTTAYASKEHWGRLVESTVGAHLISTTVGTGIELSYWNEGNKEVDFILKRQKEVIGIEVKSTMKTEKTSGLSAFRKQFNPKNIILVGAQGIPVLEFLKLHPSKLFEL